MMIATLTLTLTLLTSWHISSHAGADRAPDQDSKELIDFSSKEGAELLKRSEAKEDFFKLAMHFESQDNGIVCGLASSAIVLNALRARTGKAMPVDTSSISLKERRYLPKGYSPFIQEYTQENVFTQNTKQKIEVLGKPIQIKGKKKKDFGFQLAQLEELFASHGAVVKSRVVSDDMPEDDIRQELIENLRTANDYIVVNYARKALGQEGGGHISPVAAYDQASDRFLVMDVRPSKYPWVWVPASKLIAAMRTFDTVENRGYLLVSDIN